MINDPLLICANLAVLYTGLRSAYVLIGRPADLPGGHRIVYAAVLYVSAFVLLEPVRTVTFWTISLVRPVTDLALSTLSTIGAS